MEFVADGKRHNPLGKVFSRAELTTIGNLCVAYGLVLVSDEVYERIVFPNQSVSNMVLVHTRVASISPEIFAHTLTVVSLAKLFNATGWRVGFVIGCETLMRPVIATHLVLAYSSSGPAQDACAVGLREAERLNWWATNATDVAARIRALCSMLDDIGLTVSHLSIQWLCYLVSHSTTVRLARRCMVHLCMCGQHIGSRRLRLSSARHTTWHERLENMFLSGAGVWNHVHTR
jgi:aspartate/methionine/tyrosine aminotransferase